MHCLIVRLCLIVPLIHSMFEISYTEALPKIHCSISLMPDKFVEGTCRTPASPMQGFFLSSTQTMITVLVRL
jgi:hypothetical protein